MSDQNQKPSIGRIVHYVPSEKEKEVDNYFGNDSEVKPAIIVAVWSDTCVNLQVLHDNGREPTWVTSANQGTGVGQWHWPEKS